MKVSTLSLVFEKLKDLIEEEGIELNNNLLYMYCEQGYYEACGICNIKDMPEESISSVAFFILSNIRSERMDNIQSLNEGGRSVNFGNLTNEQLKQKALDGLKRWKKIRCV